MNEIQHLAKPKDGPAPRWFHVAVAASMVISAVSALIATIHTGNTMSALVEQNSKLVRANSTPLLQFNHRNAKADGTPYLAFNVSNVGNGLAQVSWFEFQVDGKPVADLHAALLALVGDPLAGAYFLTGPVATQVLAPGSEALILGWNRPAAGQAAELAAWNALNKARFDRIKVSACFCSIFQECWESNLQGQVPRPVAACSPQGKTSLQG
jgi:hypothetical protein